MERESRVRVLRVAGFVVYALLTERAIIVIRWEEVIALWMVVYVQL